RFSLYQGPGDLFRLEMRTAGKRFSIYQGPGDLFRLEMRTAGKRFSLYQGPGDLFRLEIGKPAMHVAGLSPNPDGLF
ncbi:TPA: hypothetical protein ACGO3S_000319, partial [Streptococcus suis]